MVPADYTGNFRGEGPSIRSGVSSFFISLQNGCETSVRSSANVTSLAHWPDIGWAAIDWGADGIALTKIGRILVFHRSQNLFLRPAFPEDWRAVLGGIAEERIVRNLATAPWPYEADHARGWCALEQDPFTPSFLVVLPAEGVVGSAGLGRDAETGKVQLGYWIAEKYWGRGFASEAARSVLKIAHAIGHKRLVASHFVDNPASGKVLRKAGFNPTGEIRPGYSLARGRHDPVACYEAELSAAIRAFSSDRASGGPSGDEPAGGAMSRAA